MGYPEVRDGQARRPPAGAGAPDDPASDEIPVNNGAASLGPRGGAHRARPQDRPGPPGTGQSGAGQSGFARPGTGAQDTGAYGAGRPGSAQPGTGAHGYGADDRAVPTGPASLGPRAL